MELGLMIEMLSFILIMTTGGFAAQSMLSYYRVRQMRIFSSLIVSVVASALVWIYFSSLTIWLLYLRVQIESAGVELLAAGILVFFVPGLAIGMWFVDRITQDIATFLLKNG